MTAEQYETAYDHLLAETVAALPKVRLVLCEPFGLPVGDEWQARQAIVAKLAAKYHAPVVHFQQVFDDACKPPG